MAAEVGDVDLAVARDTDDDDVLGVAGGFHRRSRRLATVGLVVFVVGPHWYVPGAGHELDWALWW